MKFLIAGLGSIGRRHLRNLHLLGEQDIILYRTHSATLPNGELRGYPVETDFSHAMAHKPDAVIISNPTARHLAVAMPAAEAGCAILLEKPVSDTMKGLDLLADAAEKSGSRILVGFQFRFHPTLQKASELIKNDMLGRLLTVHAHWGEYLPNWHPWEDYRKSYAARSDLGGGVIGTLTHPLDYVRSLVGEVEAIWSFNGHISPLEMDVEDAAEIGLRFSNSALGGVHVNYFQRPPVHQLEIVGTKGKLFWDNSDGILHFDQMSVEFGKVDGNPSDTVEQQFKPPADFERNMMFLEEMKHFISMVRGECESLCTLQDGVSALKMVLAAKQSAVEGRVITLNG